VLHAEDIEKVTADILSMRGEDGLTIQEKITYNKETAHLFDGWGHFEAQDVHGVLWYHFQVDEASKFVTEWQSPCHCNVNATLPCACAYLC